MKSVKYLLFNLFLLGPLTFSCLAQAVEELPLEIIAPPDLTLECDQPTDPGNTGAADVFGGCGDGEDVAITFSDSSIPGSCGGELTIVRTWVATDVCGNTVSADQLITVFDTIAPSPPAPPADLNLECSIDVPPPVDLTATDNCSADITTSPSLIVTPGGCSDDFTQIRTWTFSDDCGNTSSISQTITVADIEAPTVPAPPADLNLQCADDVPPPVDLTAVDNCDGSMTASPLQQVTTGACANDFNLVRYWTFSDVCGNTASVAQTLDVLDDVAPAITCPPDGSYETATASDNCTSPVIPTFTDNLDGTRTWDARDECDNSAMCTIILCEPDPMTAGYWNRQCLGVAQADGGLSPGRNGRGPKSPTEPDFEEVLMECTDLELADLGFFSDDTCSGIDAKPASDDCERALRQLTALVLNVCSGRLQDACPVCLASCGFDGVDGNVTELIDEIAADIQGGFCKQAAEKAALVNEGEGLCVFDN